jgi:hypothetical protein
MALRIKTLLYDQGYTIPGARQVFKNEMKAREATGPALEPSPSVIAAAPPIAEITAAPAKSEGRTAQIEARLRALRAEMESLVTLLNGSADEAGAPLRTKPLRPRLVVQPKPAKPALPKPELSRLQLTQRDLFSDGPDTIE